MTAPLAPQYDPTDIEAPLYAWWQERGLFRPEEVRRVVEANLSGREDFSLHVLQLLTLEMWQREFLDS